VTCSDCTTASQVEHHGFSTGCSGCVARGLAYIFLRRGERGRRLRQAAEQAGVTVEQVRDAWAADAANPERQP
jgi:hypothetical protein